MGGEQYSTGTGAPEPEPTVYILLMCNQNCMCACVHRTAACGYAQHRLVFAAHTLKK